MKTKTPLLKGLISALLIFGIGFTLNAQKRNSHWLTSGLNFSALQEDIIINIQESNVTSYYFKEKIGFVNISLGFKKINEKSWFQEYSITALGVSVNEDIGIRRSSDQGFFEPVNGRKKLGLNIFLRWEIGKLFKWKEQQKIQPGISLGLDPFLQYTNLIPVTSSAFPLKYYKVGNDLSFIPRLEYHLRSNLQVIIKFPLRFNSTYLLHNKIENPTLTVDQRVKNTIHNKFGDFHFQANIGIGIKI